MDVFSNVPGRKATFMKHPFFSQYYRYPDLKSRSMIIKLTEYKEELAAGELDETDVIFLHHYKYTQCNIAKACSLTGISRKKFYNMIKYNVDFKEAVALLQEDLKDLLEGVNTHKALKGDNRSKDIALKVLVADRGYGDQGVQETKQIESFEYIEIDAEKERKKLKHKKGS